MNLTYRPSNGDPNELENHFKNIISKRETTNKELVLAGDFNTNVFNLTESKMVQSFVNLMFRYSLINQHVLQERQLLQLIRSSQTQ